MPNELTVTPEMIRNYKIKAKDLLAQQDTCLYSISMSIASTAANHLLTGYGIFNGLPMSALFLSPFSYDTDMQESHSTLEYVGATISLAGSLLLLKYTLNMVESLVEKSKQDLSEHTLEALLSTTPPHVEIVNSRLSINESSTHSLKGFAATAMPVRFFSHFINTKLATNFFGLTGGVAAATAGVAVEIADIIYTANKI
jgi:hypothetical protein